MSVITISRQFGAGGITLGKMIADELGYTFADEDIVKMVAKEANVSPQMVYSVLAGKKNSQNVKQILKEALGFDLWGN